MEEKYKRSRILGYVGDVPVANTAYSGDLEKMTIEELAARHRELEKEPDPDSDEGFEAKMQELEAIRAELKKKGLSDEEVGDICYPNRPKLENKITWCKRITRIFRS